MYVIFYIWSAPFDSPPSQKLLLTLPWFRVLLFTVFLFSFEKYHLKAGTKTLSSFASFVLHLAQISISETAAPPSLHSRPGWDHLCTFWHHPDTGIFMAFQIHSGSLSRSCCQSKPVLFTSFWSAQTRFLQSQGTVVLSMIHMEKRKSLFSQGSHST